MKRIVTARKNSIYTDQDAQIVDRFIRSNKIATSKGLLASAKNSSIHNYFDWDDTSAAQKYRMQQAGNLFSMIHVEISEVMTRAYEIVYDKQTSEREYKPKELIMQDVYYFDQVIDRAKAEMANFIAKYESLKQLKKVIKGMNNFLSQEESNGKKESEGKKKSKQQNSNGRSPKRRTANTRTVKKKNKVYSKRNNATINA